MTLWVLAPEGLVILGAIGALLLPALASPRTRARMRGWLGWAAGLLTLVAFGLELWAGGQVGTLFAGGFVQDRFALFAKAVALLALLVAFAVTDWHEETLPGALPFAFLAALGMMTAASAASFIQLWAGLALSAIAGATALSRRVRGAVAAGDEGLLREGAARAALAAGALVMLAGLAFVYIAAFAGSSGLAEAGAALGTHQVSAAGTLPALVGIGALLALMLLAPFRFGAPAAAVASPLGSGVAAAFAAGAGGVALIKFGAVVVPQAIDWAVGLAGVSAVAIALAGLAAVSAGARARTVLGVAAVAQLSWVAAAVSAHDREGTAAAVLLLGPVVLALAAAPVLLGVLELGGALEPSGLAQRAPGRVAALALAGLSLAGIPPLGGFVGQALVGLAVLRTGYGAALGLALAGSLLCWLGVFRLVQAAYAGAEVEEVRGRRAPVPAVLTAASGGALLAGALLLAYTVFANPISGLAYQSAEALGLR